MQENNVIKSGEEFFALITSNSIEDYDKAYSYSAENKVWLEAIQKYPDLREEIAHNKTVKGEILEILSLDPTQDVRREVANRRAAGETLLSQLALDSKEDVRLGVLRNAKVTEHVLKILTHDKSRYVRNEAKEKLALLESKVV